MFLAQMGLSDDLQLAASILREMKPSAAVDEDFKLLLPRIATRCLEPTTEAPLAVCYLLRACRWLRTGHSHDISVLPLLLTAATSLVASLDSQPDERCASAQLLRLSKLARELIHLHRIDVDSRGTCACIALAIEVLSHPSMTECVRNVLMGATCIIDMQADRDAVALRMSPTVYAAATHFIGAGSSSLLLIVRSIPLFLAILNHGYSCGSGNNSTTCSCASLTLNLLALVSSSQCSSASADTISATWPTVVDECMLTCCNLFASLAEHDASLAASALELLSLHAAVARTSWTETSADPLLRLNPLFRCMASLGDPCLLLVTILRVFEWDPYVVLEQLQQPRTASRLSNTRCYMRSLLLAASTAPSTRLRHMCSTVDALAAIEAAEEDGDDDVESEVSRDDTRESECYIEHERVEENCDERCEMCCCCLLAGCLASIDSLLGSSSTSALPTTSVAQGRALGYTDAAHVVGVTLGEAGGDDVALHACLSVLRSGLACQQASYAE